MPSNHRNRPDGQYPDAGVRGLTREIDALDASLDPLFAAGRYRDFFDRLHATREAFRGARIPRDARDALWSRLNALAERAKRRQAGEFAARSAANLARWRASAAAAEGYLASLTSEIDALAARTGPPLELSQWRRRIAEKQERRAGVQATLLDLRRKIADVQARARATGA